MPEKDLYEHRITKLEDDVKHLYAKVNGFAIANAEMNAKLDSVLVTLGELKKRIESFSARPGKLWDKLLFAALSAVGTGFGAAVLLLLQKGG